jgi:tetratricopeptide (TPR) repeat protein
VARESLEEALALAAGAEDIYDDAFPMLLLADLEVAEGRFEVALEWLDRVGGTRGACDVPVYVEMEHSIRAEIDRLQGNGDGMVERYTWLQQHPAMRIRGRLSSSVFTWGFLLVGDLEQAEIFVRENLNYLELGEDWGLALGAVLRRRGRFDEARHALEDALLAARETLLVYREGRVLVELGELLIATGDAEGGRTRLTEALTIFEGLGASPYAGIARAALARLPGQ